MITTKNLGKKYKIDTLDPPKEFWALRGIDLHIEPGEAVGLIGLNGSGKSTLLKLLSRVVFPTEGRIELWGRVGALLEIGTGFHSELSGRENIFLAGAILGMKRSEVRKCFDEIVAFSEVETFLEMPVKRYSSGMFLRLAFSVMAHLSSEILIVDEIISVGDLSFQKKCLQKMESLSKEGKTILLVSHELKHIRDLCSRVLWLHKGKCIADGETEFILEKYECKADLQHLHTMEN